MFPPKIRWCTGEQKVANLPIIEKDHVVDEASLAEKEKIPLIYILEGILQDRAKKSKVLGKKKHGRVASI